MADTTAVTTRSEGDVVVISVDDGKANALSFDLLDQLDAAIDLASTSGKALAVIGRPGKFSAGFDLRVMTGEVAEVRRLLGRGAEVGIKILTLPIPAVFGVTGHALAMGAIMTTCADYRVGAQGEFKIGLNEVAIGMPVPAFAVELCRDRLSKRWFTRCVQHAHLCTPDEAADAGILDEVVEPDSVESRAVEMATHLAATVHPGPFRRTRENTRAGLADLLTNSLEADLARFDVSTAD